jgi:nitrogen fixation protein FixH
MLTGEARHPLGALPDIPLNFSVQRDGSFLSRQTLPNGRWTLRLEARAGSEVWKSEQALG